MIEQSKDLLSRLKRCRSLVILQAVLASLVIVPMSSSVLWFRTKMVLVVIVSFVTLGYAIAGMRRSRKEVELHGVQANDARVTSVGFEIAIAAAIVQLLPILLAALVALLPGGV